MAAATEYTNNDTIAASHRVECCVGRRPVVDESSRSAAESPKAFYLLQSNNFTNFHSVHQAARIPPIDGGEEDGGRGRRQEELAAVVGVVVDGGGGRLSMLSLLTPS